MTRFLGLLLVTATLSLGSCQCSNKPDVGPVEDEESSRLVEPAPPARSAAVDQLSRA